MNEKFSKIVTENMNIIFLLFNLKNSNNNTGETDNNEWINKIYEKHFVKIGKKYGIMLVQEREKVGNSRISLDTNPIG